MLHLDPDGHAYSLPGSPEAQGGNSPQAVQSLVLVVTADCDLRCAYCYLRRKRAGCMGPADAVAALDVALERSHSSLQVAFTGGEPLLHFAAVQRAVRYVEARGAASRVNYAIATNGSRLTASRVAFLAKHGFEVNLSFDGVPAAQAYRGRATFQHLDRLLDRLRRENWPLFDRRLRVVVTVTPATISHLADSLGYFFSKHVTTVSVSAAMRQREWRVDHLERLDREFNRVYEAALRLYENTGRVPLAQFRKTCSGPPAGEQPDSWLCRAPTGRGIAVDVDGVAYGCVLAASSYRRTPAGALAPALAALRIGRLTDPGFGEKLSALPARARACGVFQHPGRRRSSYRRCADCEFLPRCHVCPFAAGRESLHDVSLVDDFGCAFTQVVLKYADRFPRQPSTYEILTGQTPVPRLVRELMERRESARLPG